MSLGAGAESQAGQRAEVEQGSMKKPANLTEAEWAAWPKCAVPACRNKCCLRLRSRYCWPHTPGDALTAQQALTSWPFAEYVRHAWAGAWVCSAFRNESAHLSSELIREAVAATVDEYGPAPALGMITFVDTSKTRKKRDPGRCYLRTGFKNCGMTKGGLIALQLLPEDMPKPARPLDDNRGQASLFEFAASA